MCRSELWITTMSRNGGMGREDNDTPVCRKAAVLEPQTKKTPPGTGSPTGPGRAPPVSSGGHRPPRGAFAESHEFAQVRHFASAQVACSGSVKHESQQYLPRQRGRLLADGANRIKRQRQAVLAHAPAAIAPPPPPPG